MCVYIESRCGLECPPHGKAECVYTSIVIGGLTAKGSTNWAEKRLLESCGISALNLLHPALFCCSDLVFEQKNKLWEAIFFFWSSCCTQKSQQQKLLSRFSALLCWDYCPKTHFHVVSVCTANYLQLKECQEPFKLYSDPVSFLILMISFTERLGLWHSFRMRRKILLLFSRRTWRRQG